MAASNGHEAGARLLLEHKAEVDAAKQVPGARGRDGDIARSAGVWGVELLSAALEPAPGEIGLIPIRCNRGAS
jgi:hypothetical protein